MAFIASTPSSDDVHEQATFITVNNGHLMVGTSVSNPAIAIYAPGCWEHAEVK